MSKSKKQKKPENAAQPAQEAGPAVIESTVVLPDSITIDNAADLTEVFRDIVVMARGTLPIDASAIESITTPGIQLLLAAEKSLAQRGLRLKLIARSRAFDDAFRLCGLSSRLEQWS